jgi:hypothetical protein
MAGAMREVCEGIIVPPVFEFVMWCCLQGTATEGSHPDSMCRRWWAVDEKSSIRRNAIVFDNRTQN